MSEHEIAANQQPPTDTERGLRYLDLLGLSEHAGAIITRSDGTQLPVSDFLKVCGNHATGMLEDLDMMDKSSAKFKEQRTSLAAAILAAYIKPELSA